MPPTAAQDEFQHLVDQASRAERDFDHPADQHDFHHDRPTGERDEDDAWVQKRIDDTMKMPLGDRIGGLTSNFLASTGSFADSRTGVKGVIADARAYEEAKKSNGSAWGRAKDAGEKVMSKVDKRLSRGAFVNDKERDSDGSGSEADDFFDRWRLQRRMEMEKENLDKIRTRRTSPSQRQYGRLDDVDADGYLDAIEKVTRETVVVVYVYDHDVRSPQSLVLPELTLFLQCPVSQTVSEALQPLVTKYPTVHFVGVHYEEIEFDNAGVPAILAYRNCGDLFANLTYIIDQIPEKTDFDTAALEAILKAHNVL